MELHDRNTVWFLAQIKPNSSKIAEVNLKRQGFKTFLPRIEKTIRRNGKFVKVMRPLFLGYIFVGLDITQGLWRKVNSTYGITSLVSFNKTPAAVPKDLVCGLMMRYDFNAKLKPSKFFKAGDKVSLINGPFVNFVAEIEKIASDKRAWLLIEIMSNQTRVTVETDQLQIING
jgi:transcriptional antiterminator RfaH|tara:strand:+ start:563 stop:1081 length:519 start_codon:yes stop_codon:yes gene_type:complete